MGVAAIRTGGTHRSEPLVRYVDVHEGTRFLVDADPVGDGPLAVTFFKSVDIAPECERWRTFAVLPEKQVIGFSMGGVAVDLDGMIGDDMLVVCLRLGMPTDCPIAECLGVTFRYPMLIPGVGVVCRHHQCLVVPVHAASVSQKAVMNLLSILGLSDEFDEVGCDACLSHWLSQSLAC